MGRWFRTRQSVGFMVEIHLYRLVYPPEFVDGNNSSKIRTHWSTKFKTKVSKKKLPCTNPLIRHFPHRLGRAHEVLMPRPCTAIWDGNRSFSFWPAFGEYPKWGAGKIWKTPRDAVGSAVFAHGMNNLNFINRGTAQSELILSIDQAQAETAPSGLDFHFGTVNSPVSSCRLGELQFVNARFVGETKTPFLLESLRFFLVYISCVSMFFLQLTCFTVGFTILADCIFAWKNPLVFGFPKLLIAEIRIFSESPCLFLTSQFGFGKSPDLGQLIFLLGEMSWIVMVSMKSPVSPVLRFFVLSASMFKARPDLVNTGRPCAAAAEWVGGFSMV